MDGAVAVTSASRPVNITFPQAGWVEQDPQQLWTSVREAITECLRLAPGATIDAPGHHQPARIGAGLWDRDTGQPLGPCAIWQCRRSAPFCAALRHRGLGPAIEQRSGLAIDPLFSASKIRWLLDHIEDGLARARTGSIRAGTVDSWLLWQFTGGKVHRTDTTNASRTQLLNLRTVQWDDDLLEIFGISSRLPARHSAFHAASSPIPLTAPDCPAASPSPA